MSVGVEISGTRGLTRSISSSARECRVQVEGPEPIGPGSPTLHLDVAHGWRPARQIRHQVSKRAQVEGRTQRNEPRVADGQKGHSRTSRATGSSAARFSASVAPVEKPITATRSPSAASSRKATSRPISSNLSSSRRASLVPALRAREKRDPASVTPRSRRTAIRGSSS